MGRKSEIQRRGRSLTVRNPKDSTNAACNIHNGKHNAKIPKRSSYNSPLRTVEKENNPLSVIAAVAFFDHFALFGDTTLALIASFALLLVAIAISFFLEDVTDMEGIIWFLWVESILLLNPSRECAATSLYRRRTWIRNNDDDNSKVGKREFPPLASARLWRRYWWIGFDGNRRVK